MTYLRTFKIFHCDNIEVKYFGQNYQSPSQQIKITAATEIDEILLLMSKLPEKGEVMISMGPLPIISAEFYFRGEALGLLEFYGEMLKLIDTSFTKAHPAEEKELYVRLKEKLRNQSPLSGTLTE